MFINDRSMPTATMFAETSSDCITGQRHTIPEQLCAWGGIMAMCAVSVWLIGLLASHFVDSLALCAPVEVVRGLGGL